MTSWMANPVLHYALMAAGVLLCVYLFYTVKLDIRALSRRAEQGEASLMTTLERVRAERPESPTAGASRARLDLTKRTQILSMHRRGEPPASIAEGLGLPLNEVELVIKLHRLILGQS